MNDEELFYAWLDGELEGEEAERVAAGVAADPALRSTAERHRRAETALRGAFEPVLAEEIPPPRFGSAQVLEFKAKRSEPARRSTSFGLPQWAAMAATLALGIVAGQFVGTRSPSPVESNNGMLVASASLDRALDTQLASAGADDSIRVGLTFRDREGSICRSFSGSAGSGVACREGGDWRVDGLFGSSGQRDYRMAAGDDPRLAALIDDRIAGEPFDAAAEKAALERGWR